MHIFMHFEHKQIHVHACIVFTLHMEYLLNDIPFFCKAFKFTGLDALSKHLTQWRCLERVSR